MVVADAPRPVRLAGEDGCSRVPRGRMLDPAAVQQVDERTSAYWALSLAFIGSSVPSRRSCASSRQKDARCSSVPSFSTSTPSVKQPTQGVPAAGLGGAGCGPGRLTGRAAASAAAAVSSAWSASTIPSSDVALTAGAGAKATASRDQGASGPRAQSAEGADEIRHAQSPTACARTSGRSPRNGPARSSAGPDCRLTRPPA